ncbi:vegetative incompatibility protein het-e-1 [Fusarium flagelliforme]|uniref:Vegetative incompatibility protein het-e-1 n=1 Tax=Fusarium flagelliforme TaxID=2675880 RepID=A0A395MWX4_9HYPO|nr:vegetative incompatibility protein het-e-1 [Fusarium flagelliforme]
MEALGVAANVIAVVDISVKVLQVCSDYAKEAKNAKVEIQELRQEVGNLRDTAQKVQQLIQSPQGTRLRASQELLNKIKECLSILSDVDGKLQPSSKHSFWRRGFRSLKWPFQSGEVHRIVGRLSRSSISISHILQVDQTGLLLDADNKLNNVESQMNDAHSKLDKSHVKLDQAESDLRGVVTKLDKVDISQIMGQLPVAAGAAHDSQAEEDNNICLKTTRSELLHDIDEWLENTNTETIFWLQGMAGTGKSTIARTIAKRWDDQNHLGASFFFKRGGGDCGNLSCFYTTIAFQLAIRHQDLASSIKAAVDRDPSLMSKVGEEQFDKLILQPIMGLQPAKRETIAIVIDALDECDGDEGIKRLIRIFTRTKNASNVRIKVFITSRPELHIRLGFRAVPGTYQDFVLHEIPNDIIERDIRTFFTEELNRIRQDYNLMAEKEFHLPNTWPGPERTAALVDKAVPLFIFAATVCRFIRQWMSADPEVQLQKVLTFDTKSQESKMNATYLPSLEQQLGGLSKREEKDVIDDFQKIVGTIILLEAPLTVSALSKLIDVPKRSIYHRLEVLRSVLNYPETAESPIRLLHLSFRDFLLDPEKEGMNKFWVDEKQGHGRVAAHCLRILKSCLKEDICGLLAPGIACSKVTASRVSSCISPDLELCELLKDLRRFLRTNFTVVDQYPLQLYSSLRYTIPSTSPMQPIFTSSTPEWMSQFPASSSEWDLHQNVLEGHEAPIVTAAFSPDSTYMVSLSEDGNMRVWRLDTSECIRETWIEGVSFNILPTIAITTEPIWIYFKDQEEVYLWHGETAELIGQYASFADQRHKPCFSQCARYCAFMDTSNHVVLLKLKTGSPPERLSLDDSRLEHDARKKGDIPFFVFSADSKYLALYSNVRYNESLVWDIASGACVKYYSNSTIPERSHPISVMLCADHSMMVAFSPPRLGTRIQIRALPSGDLVQRFDGHKGTVSAIAFLKEGKILGSSCTENEIRTWNIETGMCLTRYVPFTSRGLIEISPSYEIACSVLETKTVSVVSYSPNDRPSIADDSTWGIESLMLSSDKTLVAAICKSDVRIHDINTGDSIFHLGNNHRDQKFEVRPTLTPNLQHIQLPMGIRWAQCLSTGDEFLEHIGQLFSSFQTCVGACSETATGPFPYTVTSSRGIAISPDGSLIALAYRDTTRISKLDTHVTTQTIQTPDETHDLMFSSDSKLLIILSRGFSKSDGVHDQKNLLYVFDIEMVDMVETIKPHGMIEKIVDICPGLGLIVLLTREYSNNNGVQIIDIKTKEVRHHFILGRMVTHVSFDSSYTTCIWSGLHHGLALSKVSTGQILTHVDMVNNLSRFNLTAGFDLVSTNIGDIQLDRQKRVTCLDDCNRVGLGLSEDTSWILWNNTKLFWLPPAIRPRGYLFEISGSTVVIHTFYGGYAAFVVVALLVSFTFYKTLLQEHGFEAETGWYGWMTG